MMPCDMAMLRALSLCNRMSVKSSQHCVLNVQTVNLWITTRFIRHAGGFALKLGYR